MSLRDDVAVALSDHDYDGDLDSWSDEDVERMVDDFDPEDDRERAKIDREIRDQIYLRAQQENVRAETYRAMTQALDFGRSEYGAKAWDDREVAENLIEELQEHYKPAPPDPRVIGGRIVR